MSTDPLEIVLITGMSGAGRGTAARLLEEFGWYVVDNLPMELIVRTAEITQNSKREIRRLAIVTDVRSQNFLAPSTSLSMSCAPAAGHPVYFSSMRPMRCLLDAITNCARPILCRISGPWRKALKTSVSYLPT